VEAREVIGLVERFAPVELAEEWDNVGWQIATPSLEVSAALLAVDVDLRVLEEAIERGANLVVSHHPLFFQPMSRLDLEAYGGRLLRRAMEAGIGIYAAHTNLDVAPGGVSDALACALELSEVRCLGARPWGGGEVGWGRAGSLSAPLSLTELASLSRSALGTSSVRLTPGREDRHLRIAVSGGSGSHFVGDAELDEVTAYVTGEIRYHEAQLARQRGLAVVEVGHFHSERPGMQSLAGFLGDSVPVTLSDVDTSPFVEPPAVDPEEGAR